MNKYIDIPSLTTEAIKSKLFDLQYHNCNGSLDTNKPPFDGNNHGCDGCTLYMQLIAELNKRNSKQNNNYE
jgi:hypothetical protein